MYVNLSRFSHDLSHISGKSEASFLTRPKLAGTGFENIRNNRFRLKDQVHFFAAGATKLMCMYRACLMTENKRRNVSPRFGKWRVRAADHDGITAVRFPNQKPSILVAGIARPHNQ